MCEGRVLAGRGKRVSAKQVMKYAKATYRGPMRMNTYRVPGDDGKRGWTFTCGVPEEVTSLESAEWLQEQEQFTVEWTVQGRAVRALTRDQYDTPAEMLTEWSYRAKQRLAKSFGIKANQAEEELEEELQDEVERLQTQMENL